MISTIMNFTGFAAFFFVLVTGVVLPWLLIIFSPIIALSAVPVGLILMAIRERVGTVRECVSRAEREFARSSLLRANRDLKGYESKMPSNVTRSNGRSQVSPRESWVMYREIRALRARGLD